MVTVGELMVPIECYATVDEEATIGKAIGVLAQARARQAAEGGDYRYRGLVVLDKQGQVVGKLSQRDIIMNLEPKYRTKKGSEAIAHTATAGFSPALLKSMIDWYSLWEESLEQKCQKALTMKVKDCMHTPRNDEYVNESESLEVAIHQLVMGHHQHLLVTRNREIIGILRLVDVFEQITEIMQELEKAQVPEHD